MSAARSSRWPIVPTLMTLVMVLAMIGLGIWQLQRREWKHALLASLDAARTLPPVTPREFYRAIIGAGSVQYRRAVVTCRPGRVAPYDIKGGASATDVSGFLVLVACKDPPLTHGRGPDLVVVAGWSARPDPPSPLLVDAEFDGVVVENPYGSAPNRPKFMLIPRTAVPPLLPSRVPTPGDLPDPHLNYALQWFAFAATLGVIYALWLRRWRATAGRAPGRADAAPGRA